MLATSLVCSTAGLNAATLTFGTSAPSGGAASISNWTGASFDADNVGGSGTNSNGSPNNGASNDGTTYVAGNRPAQGQTFTTGSNTDGYKLSAITVRMQGYTNNTATGSNIGGYDLNDTSTFRLRVGRLSGSTFIPLTQETAASGGSGNPGQGGAANGPGTYLTFTLKAPIVLAPSTTYAFDLGTTGDYFEWLGIRDGANGGNPYTGGSAYTSGTNGVANGAVTTRSGERVFQVDLTAYTAPAAGTFTHPGLLNTEADFEFIRTKVALGEEPWLTAYNALDSSWMSADGGVNSRAQAVITRGATNDTVKLYQDIAVIYASALRWKISGDTAYADQAVSLINSWSYTLTAVEGDTNVLLTELYGAQFACAAEIMRNYSGWAAADIAQCQTMLYNVFYPLANSFLTGHFGTANEHYWANWDFAAISAIYAIGVFCDNSDLTDQALAYLYNGIGNGCIDRFVNFIHSGHMGQSQEMGRDQGHATLDIAQVAALCQMAWNQGVDLYGYQNNRLLAAAEYVAKYNLGEEVPFTPYASKDWLMTGASSVSRGANNARPGWHTLYNHYVNRKGLAAPYSKQMADNMGLSGWYYNGDNLGWDALTASLPAIATGANPSGLTATVTAAQPVLSWWGSAYATSYNVKRATTSGGSYTTIASGLTTNTYTDTSVVPGTTYYYVVTATTPTGETGVSNEASALVGTALLARLKFDETTGSTAADSTANGWNGSLVNSPTWTTGTLGNAVNLAKASSQYVSLPSGIASDLSDFSVSAWVYQNSASTYARIFDFGSGGDMWGGINPWGGEIWRSERYFYLAPQAGSGKLRFGISRSAGVGEQSVQGSAALPIGEWTHVTVTKSGTVANLYVNGQLVGENASMSMSPHQLPPTPLNNIGKSQWRGDPYFDGKVDDFRIYRGALSAADTRTLANRGVAHLKFDETTGTAAADSTANGWNGTLVNGPIWNTGTLANAIDLDGSNDYVSLPSGVVNGLTTATISAWVNLDAISTWARVFDFGTGTNNYMFLAPRGGSNVIRFAIRTASVGEQQINGTAALPTGGWHHVAVTLNGSTGTLYVDGQQAGQNTGMTLNPASLGATTQNYIGKSQWNDPYLNGRVDDFRIFGSALTADQISVLAGGIANTSVAITPGDSQNALSWTAVTNATGYIVERSTTAGGPYTFLANITGTSYTDTGLTNGVTYYYVVTAQNSLGQSSGSTQASGTPVTPVPTGLVANGWDANVELSWGSVSGATYNVKRATTSGGPYTTIASSLSVADYTDIGLTNDTTYYYVVSAVKGAESANSTEASATPYDDPIVSTWFQQDVNATGVAGNASYLDGSYSVSGAGADIWGTSDAFHFVAQPLSGDGAIIARVYSQGNTNAWAKAGVMLRETTTSNSPHASSLITPSNGAAFTYRMTSGGSSASSNLAGPVAPYWVKAARSGGTFTGYVSADGDTWTTVGSQSITMATEIQAGLAVTSHNTSQLSAVVFDNVSIVPSADWASEDIGSVQLAGGSFYNNGVATLVGSGTDIWGTADTFRYTYRVATGDCDITARVTAIDNTNVWAKAGVMIRDALTAGSRHAMVVITPGSGVSFQRRTSTDGVSAHTTTSGLAAPYWVRLTRVGDVFTAYRSADGSTWTTMGTATIPMGSNVAIGLALTSHSAGTLGSGTIDNITVNP